MIQKGGKISFPLALLFTFSLSEVAQANLFSI